MMVRLKVFVFIILNAACDARNSVQQKSSHISEQNKTPRNLLERGRLMTKKRVKKTKKPKKSWKKIAWDDSRSATSEASSTPEEELRSSVREESATVGGENAAAGAAGSWPDQGGNGENFAHSTLPTTSPAPTCLECDDHPYLKTRSPSVRPHHSMEEASRHQNGVTERQVGIVGILCLLFLSLGVLLLSRYKFRHDQRRRLGGKARGSNDVVEATGSE